MPTNFSRARLGAAVLTAFACGLLFASGFDLTRFGFAQDGSKSAKVAPSQVESLAETGGAFEAIADHVTPSVVSIQTTRVPAARQRGTAPDIQDFFRNFEPPGQRSAPQEASGTGFIVSKDGFILTNNHVVADADKVTVTLLDKRIFEAKVIGRDPSTDVAVIKIDGVDLPPVALGDDNKARVGQWVVAIGNPLGLDFTVTAGIISAKGRPLPGLLSRETRYAITDYIQTDAAINPGNSGGPLVNIRGEVIGVNSAIASSTGFYAGYGFAIPVTLAKQVMDDLIKYGKVRRAVIGVQIDNASAVDAKAAGMKEVTGVVVSAYSLDAAGNSPAKTAGIEPGDVIISADGKKTDRVSTLQRIIRTHKPGETVELEVMHFGQKKTLKVKLIEAPEAQQLASAEQAPAVVAPATEGRRFDKVGITAEPVSPAFIARTRLAEPYRKGLLVSEVSVTGPAYRKVLADNTILVRILNPGPARDLNTVADLDAALSRLKAGDVVTFLVYEPRSGTEGLTRAVSVEVGG